MNVSGRQQTYRKVSLLLLIITASSALVAGALFIIDPSGHKMGMSLTYLRFTPFISFLIPGIVLFTVNGLMNLIVAYLVIQQNKRSPQLIIIQGVILVGWIVVQVVMVRDFNFLHGSMLLIGSVLVVFGLKLRKSDKGEFN